MTVLAVELGFALQCCPHCSAAFMLPTIDLEARTANGRSHFCPNGHEVHSSAESELAQARWQLAAALSGWEEEAGDLKAEVAGLQQQLAAEKVRAVELIAQVVAGQDDASALVELRGKFDRARDAWTDEISRLEAIIAELQRKPEPETPAVLAYGSGAAPVTLELLADMATVMDRDQEFMPAPPDLPPLGAYADDDPEAHASAPVITSWRDGVEPKTCGNRDCRKEFRPSPNVAGGIWKRQKYCSHKCAVKENARLAKERHEQQAAVPPTLTDSQYGGPEAPPEAVEQAEQVTEQVTEQVIEQVIEQAADSDKEDEALGLFHDRYPDMTPRLAWQEHGEEATAYWLECLEMAGALDGGQHGKKLGRLEPQPKVEPSTPGASR